MSICYNLLHSLKIIKAAEMKKETKGIWRAWPTDRASWVLGTNVDPEAIHTTNVPAPLSKVPLVRFSVCLPIDVRLKTGSFEERCLFPFCLLPSHLFGTLLSKPGDGDLLGHYVICRISSFVRVLSSFVWCRTGSTCGLGTHVLTPCVLKHA